VTLRKAIVCLTLSLNVADITAIFRAAVTVILALTKCAPGGERIKLIIRPTNTLELMNQGANHTRVYMSREDPSTGQWEEWSKELDRDNLEKVEDRIFGRDPEGPEYDNLW
jgi:hypothetical protein